MPSTAPDIPPYLSSTDICRLARFSRHYFYRMQATLPPLFPPPDRKFGRQHIWDRATFLKWVEAQELK